MIDVLDYWGFCLRDFLVLGCLILGSLGGLHRAEARDGAKAGAYQALFDFFEHSSLDEESCSNELSPMLTNFLLQDAQDLHRSHIPSLSSIEELWLIRQLAHDSLSQAYFQLAEEYDHQYAVDFLSPCVAVLRVLMRLARYSEEIQVLRGWGNPELPGILEGPKPFLYLTSTVQDVWDRDDLAANLQTGDIILTRSDASVSGVVSRVADSPHQYAHLAVVYRDEETGEISTLEKLIERNLVVSSIEEWQKKSLSRLAVFRFRAEFRELAVESVRNLKATVDLIEEAGGRFIYDFRYDDGVSNRQQWPKDIETPLGLMSRYPRTHCSGLLEICVGPLIPEFPVFPSSLKEVDSRFLDYLQIQTPSLFMPSDLEVDPFVELVAEWRQPSRLRNTQIMDIVVDRSLQWMREKNYVFMENQLTDSFKASAVALFRHLGVARNRISKDVPKPLLEAIINIDTVTKALASELRAVDDEFRLSQSEETELPVFLGWSEMLSELEVIRQKDWEQFRAWYWNGHHRASRFHGRFRPADIYDPSLH